MIGRHVVGGSHLKKKKDPRNQRGVLSNYRGITLVSCLGKASQLSEPHLEEETMTNCPYLDVDIGPTFYPGMKLLDGGMGVCLSVYSVSIFEEEPF